jgi:hypothetical protein
LAVLLEPASLFLREHAPRAVLLVPLELFSSAPCQIAVFSNIFPPHRPTVKSLIITSEIVTRFHALVIRIASMLFVRNTRSVLSVVPMN